MSFLWLIIGFDFGDSLIGAPYKSCDSDMLQNYGAGLWCKIYSKNHPSLHIIRLLLRATVPRDVLQPAVLFFLRSSLSKRFN